MQARTEPRPPLADIAAYTAGSVHWRGGRTERCVGRRGASGRHGDLLGIPRELLKLEPWAGSLEVVDVFRHDSTTLDVEPRQLGNDLQITQASAGQWHAGEREDLKRLKWAWPPSFLISSRWRESASLIPSTLGKSSICGKPPLPTIRPANVKTAPRYRARATISTAVGATVLIRYRFLAPSDCPSIVVGKLKDAAWLSG